MKRTKAFTLIELLVVIAIISILLSILIPSLKVAKKQVQATICKHNLKQWHMVFMLYTTDNDDSFHSGWGGTGPASHWWMDAGREYYGDVGEIRCCPTATLTRYNIDRTPGPGAGRAPFMAWGIDNGNFFKRGDYGSYGINGWVLNPTTVTDPVRLNKYWKKMTVLGSSNIPLMTDAQWIDFWPEPGEVPPRYENVVWNDDSTGRVGSHFERFVQNRHHEKQDVGFLDGSVDKVGLKELWTFKWYDGYNQSGPWTLSGGVTRDDWPEWMRSFKDY